MIKLKCDECGKELEVDKQEEYAVCFNCNKMFKLDGVGGNLNKTKEVTTEKNNTLKCENCGSKLEVDKLGEYGVCFNCNSMFKLEKKIVKDKKSDEIKLKPYQFIIVALLIAAIVGLNAGLKLNSVKFKKKSYTDKYFEEQYAKINFDDDLKVSNMIFKNIMNGEDDVIVEYNGVYYTKERLDILYQLIKSKDIRLDISYVNNKVSKVSIKDIK